MPRARESTNVAAVANEITRDDRTDTEHLSHRRARRLHGIVDTSVKLDEGEINATNLVEELDRDPFAFDPDRVDRPDLA